MSQGGCSSSGRIRPYGSEPAGTSGSIIADPNPVPLADASRRAVVNLVWSSKGAEMLEVHVGAPDGPLLSRSGPSGRTTTGKWVYNGMTFYLQDVTAGRPLDSRHTLSQVTIEVVLAEPPVNTPVDRVIKLWRFALGWLYAKVRGKEYCPPAGLVLFGSLRRTKPISNTWGTDRGLPVDRYYIEDFLARHAADIHGNVLAVGDDAYTRMFGGSQVAKSDVLNLLGGDPGTTIVGDLTDAPHIPANTFDCIICPQTLQLIYDVKSAIRTLHRILRPGGVLLATFPGISKTSDSVWGDYWCWNFTPASAKRLFGEVFSAGAYTVEAHGNVLSAVSFLHGLAVEELRKEELDQYLRGYEIVIAVRAAKPKD